MKFRLCFVTALTLFAAGCGETAKEQPAVAIPPAASAQKPTVLEMAPSVITVGQKFNTQPDGTSALGMKVKDATGAAVIVFGTRPLVTAHGPGVLSALVPADLYSTPGTTPVFIRDAGGESNRVDFVVKPK
jgi:hypothetical protein